MSRHAKGNSHVSNASGLTVWWFGLVRGCPTVLYSVLYIPSFKILPRVRSDITAKYN